MEDDLFLKLVKDSIEEIPLEYREKLKNVAILVSNYPSYDQIRKSKIHRHSVLLGLYEGIPATNYKTISGALPAKITIFQKAIEARSSNELELKQIIKNVVIHEIGHYFGLNEDEVRAMEKKRNMQY